VGGVDEMFVERDPMRVPLGALVARAGVALTRRQQRLAIAHGVTVTGLGVLGVLDRDAGLSHRELAGRLGVTPATLTPVLDALEAAGEVRRTRDRDDRRVVRLTATPAGQDRWVAASTEVARAMRRDLPTASPDDEATIRRYLGAVLAAVDLD